MYLFIWSVKCQNCSGNFILRYFLSKNQSILYRSKSFKNLFDFFKSKSRLDLKVPKNRLLTRLDLVYIAPHIWASFNFFFMGRFVQETFVTAKRMYFCSQTFCTTSRSFTRAESSAVASLLNRLCSVLSNPVPLAQPTTVPMLSQTNSALTSHTICDGQCFLGESVYCLNAARNEISYDCLIN